MVLPFPNPWHHSAQEFGAEILNSGGSPRKKTLKLTVEFSVPTAGEFEIYFAGTKAVDYGIHSFTINGSALGEAQDFFQPSSVSHTGQVRLGKATLSAGKNTLTIISSGTNPKAVKKTHVRSRLPPIGTRRIDHFSRSVNMLLSLRANHLDWAEVIPFLPSLRSKYGLQSLPPKGNF